MGCGCGGNKREFEHIAPDGKVTIVNSQYEAIRLVAKQGGTWKPKQKNK